MKKLSVKTNKKTGKLVIHKNKAKESEVADDPPFDPDEEEVDMENAVATEAGESVIAAVEGKKVIGNTHIQEVNSEAVDEAEEVAEAQISGPAANVGYGIARTINLGNYESVKISVDIHVPSEVDEDEIEGNYEFAKGWCEEKMEEIVTEYTG